jgi:ceramide glucosyltransferase
MTTLLTLVAFLALVLTIAAALAAHVHLSRASRIKAGPSPPISILKPLAGIDDGLFENLASFARQTYPAFEIVLGTESDDDPALVIAHRLRAQFPKVPIRIVSSAPAFGRNPKVTNLASLARFASHDLVLVSDSNVRVASDYLTTIAAELRDPRVGLVANMIAGSGDETLGALFENLHLNSFVTSAVAFCRFAARHACVIGKSMLFRRSDLEAIGGWRSVRNILAEDYVLGRRFEQRGFRVVISAYAIDTVNTRWSLRRFVNRHVRWAQMRRRIAPVAFAAELLLNPTPLLILVVLAAIDARDLDGYPPLALALAALFGIALKSGSDAILFERLARRPLTLIEIAWIPLKDVLLLGLWCVALVRRTVTWRGHVLFIGPKSRLVRPYARSVLGRRRRTAKQVA